jgi:hypothetical protein
LQQLHTWLEAASESTWHDPTSDIEDSSPASHILVPCTSTLGVPALAASYANARFLEQVPVVLDFAKHPGDALDRRGADLAAAADAAVIGLGDAYDAEALEVLALAKRTGVPVLTLTKARSEPRARVAIPAPLGRGRGRPD